MNTPEEIKKVYEETPEEVYSYIYSNKFISSLESKLGEINLTRDQKNNITSLVQSFLASVFSIDELRAGLYKITENKVFSDTLIKWLNENSIKEIYDLVLDSYINDKLNDNENENYIEQASNKNISDNLTTDKTGIGEKLFKPIVIKPEIKNTEQKESSIKKLDPYREAVEE